MYDEDDDQEMPTPCEHCHKIFDLNDGYGSEKWHPDIVICEKCHNEEKLEIERDDEISDLQSQIDDAEFTIIDCLKRAKEIDHKLSLKLNISIDGL